MRKEVGVEQCPECGAALVGREACDELFHQVLAWEQYDIEGNGRYHHMLVMSWELQHPSRFSDETLTWARESLARSISGEVSAQQLRREVSEWAPQDKRAFKITRTGGMIVPRRWSLTLADVVAEGLEGMPESVRTWATAVSNDLELDAGAAGPAREGR